MKDIDSAVHLWMEKELKSVADVGRRDVRDFSEPAANIPIHPGVRIYGLEEADQALMELKQRQVRGAKVRVL